MKRSLIVLLSLFSLSTFSVSTVQADTWKSKAEKYIKPTFKIAMGTTLVLFAVKGFRDWQYFRAFAKQNSAKELLPLLEKAREADSNGALAHACLSLFPFASAIKDLRK